MPGPAEGRGLGEGTNLGKAGKGLLEAREVLVREEERALRLVFRFETGP